MPAIIALLLRQVIMSIATGAIVTGAQEMLDGTAKELVKEIKDTEGVTEQDAKDIIGNIFIDLAVNSASIFAVLRTGAGVKTAEFLGLTSKGFAKKKLAGKAAKVATTLAAGSINTTTKSIIPKILKVAAIPGGVIWLASALANIIEPGIYKPVQTNALYKKLGIPFQYPITEGSLKPGPFTVDSFKDYAKGLEEAGITGVLNPVAMQSQLYSRENLADVVNYVYGKKVFDGIALSANKLIPFLDEYLIVKGTRNITTTTSPQTTQKIAIKEIPKVFTGIVSQGVVGAGLTFTARPDDLIESADELRQAAANNLTPFLNTLLGKIVYEVKVVSSIITKDGFKQSGTTQRIQSGTYSNGQPKYKSVTNKFATLVVYALTDKGSRAKLTTIVLGPVDSAKLTVGENDLRTLETQLPSLVTTNDINEIDVIKTNTPTEIITEEIKPIEQPIEPVQKVEKVQKYNNSELVEEYYVDKVTRAIVPAPAPVVISPVATTQKSGVNAKTLFEWYQAQGQALPSVSARSVIYEGLGLGSKNYYTGTAEQNTKLLNALKSS